MKLAFRIKRLAFFASLSLIAAHASAASTVLPIPKASVTDNGNDGNIASNTVDGSTSTRWSAEGLDKWVQYKLGSCQTIDTVKIAWYKGSSRKATYSVQISADNGISWTTLKDRAVSSGSTSSLETVALTPTGGNTVRIVGYGNSSNAWNSITEVKWSSQGASSACSGITPTATPIPTMTPTPTITPTINPSITPTTTPTITPIPTSTGSTLTIAAGGDWGDKWGSTGVTELSIKAAAKHDFIAMQGDLSYADNSSSAARIANAKDWCNRIKSFSPNTQIAFVPGDHDSINQDGDVMTYAGCLNTPDGTGVSSAPQIASPVSTNSYKGKYPWLYYVDIKKGDVTVRLVGTSVAYEEPTGNPSDTQWMKGYGVGSNNYKWLSEVYADGKNKGYWLVHMNHLPCIDMGKNKSFTDCQAIVDLDAAAGVNVLMSGSSHNVWRTKALRINNSCPSIALTTSSSGGNANCAYDNHTSSYLVSDGLVNAHNGAAGKTSASAGPNCDVNADGEVRHYARAGACWVNSTPGIVSLSFTSKTLIGKFVPVTSVPSNVDVSRYTFSITKP